MTPCSVFVVSSFILLIIRFAWLSVVTPYLFQFHVLFMYIYVVYCLSNSVVFWRLGVALITVFLRNVLYITHLNFNWNFCIKLFFNV